MTIVHIVTLNGFVQGVYETSDLADAAMRIHREAHRREGEWRPVGDAGWASPQTTNLSRRAWELRAAC